MLKLNSIDDIQCFGSNVFIKIINKYDDVCKGEVAAIGTTSTIKLQKGNIVYFNINDVSATIAIKDDYIVSIAHYKIFGLQTFKSYMKEIVNF